MPATTNFLQWNPGQSNQESDAQYLIDTQRTGGAQVKDQFASPLANKLFYQNSTFIAAMCQMLAGKGYSTSDADLGALASVLANLLTNADLRNGFVTLPYSATPAYDLSQGGAFGITLSGNITPTITNALPGQLVAFFFKQDATGGRTVTWPANTSGGYQPTPAANAVSVQIFMVYSDGKLYSIMPAPATLYSVDLTSQSTSLGPVTLVTPSAAGLYVAQAEGYIISPAGGSVTLTINFTQNGSVGFGSQIFALITSGGAGSPTHTGGTVLVYSDAGQPITYRTAWSPSGDRKSVV